jgi:hypothetical protein
VGSLLFGLLILSSGAAAKEFKPGDLSVCNASRCVSIRGQSVLSALASFYYDGAQPQARAGAPGLGVPFFQLEFSNGYVTGIVAGTGIGRFLSYGVNLDQFQGGVWYRVPARAVAGLRSLTVGLAPLRLTTAALTVPGTFSVRTLGVRQPSPRIPRPAASGRHGNSWRWSLGLVPLAALIALVLLARRRRRWVFRDAVDFGRSRSCRG